jgi:hypothetical protein
MNRGLALSLRQRDDWSISCLLHKISKFDFRYFILEFDIHYNNFEFRYVCLSVRPKM